MRAQHCTIFHCSILELINQGSREVNEISLMSLGGEPMTERTEDSVSRNGANQGVNEA